MYQASHVQIRLISLKSFFQAPRFCLSSTSPEACQHLELDRAESHTAAKSASPCVKDFPKAAEDPHRFEDEFNMVIQTCSLGFSDLYRLVHMPVGESQAQRWIALPQWGLPERDSEKPASIVLGGRWRPWQREPTQ